MKKISFLLSILFAFILNINAQIPNHGFEDWTNFGNYEDPVGWATMNSISTGPFYSCTKSTDHYPATIGNYSVRLENNTSLTQMTGAFGMAVTDTFAFPFQPAFPVSGNPTSLCGYYKYFPQNNDSMWIKIFLFNNGLIVMDEQITYSNTASTWTPFTIPFDPYTTADSATIVICAFLPQGSTPAPFGNSVLYVDNLSFDNHITSVKDITADPWKFNIYPNPVSDIFTLDINETNIVDITLNIYNSVGKLVRTELLEKNLQQNNIGDLSDGIYMVEIKSKERVAIQKLIIQK